MGPTPRRLENFAALGQETALFSPGPVLTLWSLVNPLRPETDIEDRLHQAKSGPPGKESMGSSTNNEPFSAPPVQADFDGILFDMDGTLVDSTSAVVKHWHTWVLSGRHQKKDSSRLADEALARRIGTEIGVDPDLILQTSHGRRSIDTLKVIAPEKANWDCMSRVMPCLLVNELGTFDDD
jgi:hypothetical protein